MVHTSWHVKKGFEARDMGNHCVLFVFMEEFDIDKVLASEPWSFDKNLVALKRVSRLAEVRGLNFYRVSFWIQVHDLPLGSLNMCIASNIVLSAGTVIQGSGDAKEFEGGNYMQVRVSIDITKPLSRGRKFEFENGEESWASFKYERLPNLCYWCGCLTHQDRDCSLGQNRKGSLLARNQQFGPWLRVGTPNLAKRTIVKVAGYEKDVKGGC
nr:uncharacterized protein CFP56_05105 [Quercus suber]